MAKILKGPVTALLETCERVANDIDGYLEGDWDGVDGFVALAAALRRDTDPVQFQLADAAPTLLLALKRCESVLTSKFGECNEGRDTPMAKLLKDTRSAIAEADQTQAFCDKPITPSPSNRPPL